jgi:hypothetical protein
LSFLSSHYRITLTFMPIFALTSIGSLGFGGVGLRI